MLAEGSIAANDSAGALSQDHASASNSPNLGSLGLTQVEHASEDDNDEFIPERDPEEADSEDSWDEQQDRTRAMLPEAALQPHHSSEKNDQSDEEDGMLPRDKQKKTAYYDYAAEKQLSQTDAKMFYQRSQLESQKTGGSNWGNSQQSPEISPVMSAMSRAYSGVFESDYPGVERSGISKNRQTMGSRLVDWVSVEVQFTD
jgi:AMP deaminase